MLARPPGVEDRRSFGREAAMCELLRDAESLDDSVAAVASRGAFVILHKACIEVELSLNSITATSGSAGRRRPHVPA